MLKNYLLLLRCSLYGLFFLVLPPFAIILYCLLSLYSIIYIKVLDGNFLYFIIAITIAIVLTHLYTLFIGSYKITNIKENLENQIANKDKEITKTKMECEAKKRILDADWKLKCHILSDKEIKMRTLMRSSSPFKDSAAMIANVETAILKERSVYFTKKRKPSSNSANEVRILRNQMKIIISDLKAKEYKYDFLLSVFPELKRYVEDEESLVKLADYSDMADFNDKRDRTLDWISIEEYKTMPVDERNQLALDRYKKKVKSNWELGIEYELYIGYLLREGKKPFNKRYHIVQFGELHGLSDLGRDIIAEEVNLNGGRTIYIIQCKRWSDKKVIHENAICQLYGTTIEYKIRHRHFINCKFIPVFVSTTELSDMAKEFAKCLDVIVYIIPMGEYPMIKCNINGSEKIYHLPFDQQYHRTEIKNEGEFYAMTVKDATSKGFRRAMRHFTN